MLPLLWGVLLWVGMSVPAHPQAIERLERQGKRGWLKPPPPEEGFGRDVETYPVNPVHPVCSSSLFGQDLQDLQD